MVNIKKIHNSRKYYKKTYNRDSNIMVRKTKYCKIINHPKLFYRLNTTVLKSQWDFM